MGRVKEYDDCYAQVRKFNDHNISICYWNNNVSLNDFKWKDDIGYVYEHEGDYQGLRAKIRITLEERRLRRLFCKRDERGPVRFRGTLDHMGIRIHMRRNAFPAKQSGEVDGLTYTIEMSGTDKFLSYADDRELQERRRRRIEREKERIKNGGVRPENGLHRAPREVPKYLQDGMRRPFRGGSCTPR